jgi:hypothetical protein
MREGSLHTKTSQSDEITSTSNREIGDPEEAALMFCEIRGTLLEQQYASGINM